MFHLAFWSDTVTTEQTRTLGNVSDSVCTLQTVFPSDQQSWHAHHTEDEEHEYISIQKPLFDIHSFTSKQVSWKFVDESFWDNPSIGWKGSVCNLFPTPVHNVLHTGAVLPDT